SCSVVCFLLRPTKTETAVQRRLEDIQITRAEETGKTILKEEGYSRNPEVSQLIRQVPGALGTLDLLRQSGKQWTVSSVMGISLATTFLAAWISSLFLPSVLLGVLVGVVAGSIPYIYLVIMREIRFRKCDELLPQAI